MDPNNVRVITNNVPREILDGCQLTRDERKQFDYINWPAVDNGADSATFFRYKGEVYDLGEFTPDWGILKGSGMPAHLSQWHGYMSESAFSAIVVRFTDDHEHVIVGRVLC